MIKKSDKSPPMMNGDEGGQLSDFIGGDIRLIGGIPPVPPPLGKTLGGDIFWNNPMQFILSSRYFKLGQLADHASF